MVPPDNQGPLGRCGEEDGAVDGQGHTSGFPWPPFTATAYCETWGRSFTSHLELLFSSQSSGDKNNAILTL